MLLAYEEAIGFCLGDVVNDKDALEPYTTYQQTIDGVK